MCAKGLTWEGDFSAIVFKIYNLSLSSFKSTLLSSLSLRLVVSSVKLSGPKQPDEEKNQYSYANKCSNARDDGWEKAFST